VHIDIVISVWMKEEPRLRHRTKSRELINRHSVHAFLEYAVTVEIENSASLLVSEGNAMHIGDPKCL
tara:strand:+ start:238 stop:438 length:201 start_codon:yes stop_codon:yes gene_type:complete